MKSSTEDQVQGKFHEVKGAIKKKIGEVTDNPDLRDEGEIEETAGTIQKKVGQIKQVFDK